MKIFRSLTKLPINQRSIGGFSLIEVSIALFIVAVGLLSISTLQLLALQQTQKAYFYSVATSQLSSMLERLRANHSSRWEDEFQDWNQLNQQLLPHGEGSYHCAQGVQGDKSTKIAQGAQSGQAGFTLCSVDLIWKGDSQKISAKFDLQRGRTALKSW